MIPQVKLLGQTQVLCADGWRPLPMDKRGALLAVLAYHGDWMSREKLAFLFWPDVEETRSRHDLRQLIYRTKALSFAANLEIQPGSLCWRIETDVCNFRQAVAQQDWTAAVVLYRGEMLQELHLGDSLEFMSWLELERENLHALWRKAVIERATELESTSRCLEAAALLKALVEGDELDENALRLYLRNAVLGGRREEALGTYERFAQRLDEELGLKPLPATQEVVEAVRSGLPIIRNASEGAERASETSRASPWHLRNFPLESTSFIGRDLELTEIVNLLNQPSCRLLTLVGPGGIGKTRLAQEAALEVARGYADGVTFVPLAPVATATLLASAIASALSFPFYGQGEPEAQLIRYLREKEILLLLDNLEHLREGVPFISILLAGCPGLKILTTSRERLNLTCEWLFHVGGMSLPEDQGATWLGGFDAVQLFLHRARRVGIDIVLNADNRAMIVRICQLVGGAPLGIELAAGWVEMLSCQEIAEEMEKGFDFLTTSLHDAPERHRSLRQVFEHSWKLLTDKEQTSFKRLSVFRGGFTRSAAEAVTDASMRVLLSLLGKSLIKRDSSGRFDLHELVKQYAAEKLGETPEEEFETHDRHTAFYAAFLHERDHWLKGGERQQVSLQEIGEEIDNVRSAWDWAVERRNSEALEQAASCIRFFYQTRGFYQEGEEAFRLAADTFTQESVTYGTLLLFQGLFTWWVGRYHAALDIAECSLAMLDRQQAPSGMLANANFLLGLVYRDTGELERANHQFGKALRLARKGGEAFFEARALQNLGVIAESKGAFDKAERRYRQGIAVYRQAEERYGLAMGLSDLGGLLERRGQFEAARQQYLEGLDAARAVGSRLRIAQALIHLGGLSYSQGQYQQAEAYYKECVSLVKGRSDEPYRSSAKHCLIGLGEAACALEKFRESFQYFHESIKIALSTYDVVSMTRSLVGIADLLVSLGKQGEALTLLFFSLEQLEIEKDTRERAERLFTNIAAQLPEPAVALAQERGQVLKYKGITGLLSDWQQHIES
jgi:predicted ATPase/DNA-binding SARP family transcriptional activator/Tfp pilus assembly protein PilF